MNCMTNLKVDDNIREYLPGFSLTKPATEATKVPVMSNQTVEIFSKIRQSIPDTLENFMSVKTLEVTAKEITASVNEIDKLKKSETAHKVGSILLLVGSVILVAAVIAVSITLPILFPIFDIAAFLVPTLIVPVGGGLGLPALVVSSCCTLQAFNNIRDAQKKLSIQVEEAKVNHEKFKEYFTVNYQDLKKGIDDSLETHQKNRELIIATEGEDCEKLKMKFAADSKVLEQARVQLKNLHKFYTQPTPTK